VKYEKMSKQAMWEIGTELIADYLKSKDYTILETSPFYYTYPNVVAKKDDKLYGVIIDANEIHNQPKHSVRRTFDMMRFARKFDAVPL
jgi:hypothetical protein